jgi:hypothetical protein
MLDDDESKIVEQVEEGFKLLTVDPLSAAGYEDAKREDLEWKTRDPVGFKQDMEQMCRAMFADDWEIQYKAMLREEFPDER